MDLPRLLYVETCIACLERATDLREVGRASSVFLNGEESRDKFCSIHGVALTRVVYQKEEPDE